jgi:hypothetical protein
MPGSEPVPRVEKHSNRELVELDPALGEPKLVMPDECNNHEHQRVAGERSDPRVRLNLLQHLLGFGLRTREVRVFGMSPLLEGPRPIQAFPGSPQRRAHKCERGVG